MSTLRYIPKKGVWQFCSKEGKIIENQLLRTIWQQMVWNYEIVSDDIGFAVSEMERLGHNMAEFGVLGGFTLTSKD